MLGAAVAGAVSVDDAGLGSFPFFSNGEPNVKIVVGSAAMPSDAVAAANIAAMVGNLAYTSKDITVLGTTGLTCTGGAGSTGTVAGQVSASVTTPGVNPNVAYQMKTYLEGYLDKDTTDNRVDAWSVADGNPAAAGRVMPSDASTGTTYAGRKVTNYETSALAFKGTISDTKASKSYTEEERYYLYSNPAYDTSSKEVKGKATRIGYETQFTDPIPVCTNASPSATSCTSKVYESARHHIKIKFLGADWVVYGLENFAYDGGGTTSSVMGSAKVTLGKEVAYNPFMSIGDEITAPNGIKVKLVDISSFGYGTVSQPKATFKVYNSAGTEIDTAILQPTDEYNDNGIVIHEYDAVAGVAGTSNVEISIFSEKLELTHNSVVNTDNSPWRVTLWGGGSTFGASLARIQMQNIADVPYLRANEYMNIIKKPAAMKMTFNGLETPSSTDTLSLTTLVPQYFPYTTTDTTSKGYAVQLSSTRSNAFQFASGDSASTVYYVIGGMAGNARRGSLYYYKTGSSSVMYNMYNHTAATVNFTLPIGPITLANGNPAGLALSGWRMNPVGANGTSICNSQFGYGGITNVTAVSGVTPSAVGVASNGSLNTIDATGTIATLYNEPSILTTTLAPTTAGGNVTIVNGTTSSSCNGTWILNLTGAASLNGTLTGVSVADFLTNYVTYNYGPTSVVIGFNSTALEAAALSGTVPHLTMYTIHIPEYTTDTDGALYAFKVAVGGSETTTPGFANTGSLAYIGYGEHPGAQTTGYHGINNTATNYESGFISRRGGTATVGTSSVSISYPSTLSHAIYTLSSADTDTTSNTATVTGGVGSTLLNSGGYIVNVTGVGGSCGTGATGGDVSGTESLTCSEASAYTVTPMDTSSTPLVVLDSSSYAAGTQPLIVVGGPIVNTVASSTLSGGINPTDEPMVKVVGDKIVVAGYTAADTTSAANALIGWLTTNRDTLQR